MVFRTLHKLGSRSALGGFTLVEAVISIGLIGVGAASTVGTLTKMNQIASASRYRTAAYAAVTSQINLFQSVGPFNPQNTPPQVPWAVDGTYDLRLGTHAIGYKDPSTSVGSAVSPTWPIYRESARWTYANAAARTGAGGFEAGDVGQLAYQIDSQTYWRLQSIGPSWVADSSVALFVPGTMTTMVTNISTVSMPNTYNALVTLTYKYLGRDYQFAMSAIRTSDK